MLMHQHLIPLYLSCSFSVWPNFGELGVVEFAIIIPGKWGNAGYRVMRREAHYYSIPVLKKKSEE